MILDGEGPSKKDEQIHTHNSGSENGDDHVGTDGGNNMSYSQMQLPAV